MKIDFEELRNHPIIVMIGIAAATITVIGFLRR